MTKKVTEVKASRIEILLKQAETTSNKALKNALEQHAAEEQKKEEAKLLEQFDIASKTLEIYVRNLVRVRKEERSVRDKVKAIDTALEQFKIDGNYDSFVTACNKCGAWIQ